MFQAEGQMICLVFVLFTAHCVTSAPVTSTAENAQEQEKTQEYEHYLNEVQESLHFDPETLASLKNLVNKNKTGSKYLRLLNSSLRDLPDELKRHVVEELIDARPLETIHDPDSENGENLIRIRKPSSMELVKKAAERLKKLDLLQEKQFKDHMAKKKAEAIQKFAELSEKDRAKMIQQSKDAAAKHHKRPKIHEPGSDEQLKEYWEKQEGMDRVQFNPRTMFSDIDLDGDGYLNIYEIEAVLQRELDKVYDPNDPDFDPWEGKYDQNKMRQRFLEKYDTDGDYFVSRDEFIKGANSIYAKMNEGWKPAQDEEDEFETNEQELKRLAREVQLRQETHVTQQSHSPSSEPPTKV